MVSDYGSSSVITEGRFHSQAVGVKRLGMMLRSGFGIIFGRTRKGWGEGVSGGSSARIFEEHLKDFVDEEFGHGGQGCCPLKCDIGVQQGTHFFASLLVP